LRGKGVFRHPALVTAIVCVAVLLVLSFGYALKSHLDQRLPREYSFDFNALDHWEAFGGDWKSGDGSVRNSPLGSGGKIVTGSPQWADYRLDADVMLLDNFGDAGVVIRSSQEEVGVDAYSGYYVGLAIAEGDIIVGRANYGWSEYDSAKFPKKLVPFHWYHISTAAVDCTITARVSDPDDDVFSSISMTEDDQHCARVGRIGLRSMVAAAAWRNVRVKPATVVSADSLAQHPDDIQHKLSPPTLEEVLSRYKDRFIGTLPIGQNPLPMNTSPEPIEDLRLASATKKEERTILGRVTLTAPELFVEDSTGGVYVSPNGSPRLKIGDPVLVTGIATPRAYSWAITNALVSVLGHADPSPAISVTAFQAATGKFDARFVETQGIFDGKEVRQPDGILVLQFHDGEQQFSVQIDKSDTTTSVRNLKHRSLVRIKGLCTVDRRYTQSKVPFALLVHSSNDIQILAGPPWWSAQKLLPASMIVLLLTLTAYSVYARVRQWQLASLVSERQRLAHELHDTLAQSFAGIGFQLRAIRGRLTEISPATHLIEQVDVASELVRRGHDEAKQSMATLRPSVGEAVELLPALVNVARKMTANVDLLFDTKVIGSPRHIPIRTADVLFRVGQEALANAIRHANATKIDMALLYSDSSVRLTVKDNGVGLKQSQSPTSGFGIFGMRQRMITIKGTLRIEGSLEGGTIVEAEAPLKKRGWYRRWLT
jgi:signal transduction histidine kinase